MQRLELQASSRRAHVSTAAAALLVIAALALPACSQVPDYANPIEWYHSVTGPSDGEAAQEAAFAEPVPGADAPYPKLSTVPPMPSRTTISEMKAIAEGLIADRENARYTDQVIRRGGEVPEPAPAPAPPQPAPAPESSLPVEPVPASLLQTVASKTTVAPAYAIPALSNQPLIAQPFEKAPQPVPVPVPAAKPPEPAGGGLEIKRLFNNLFEASGPGANAPATPPVQPAAPVVVSMPAAQASEFTLVPPPVAVVEAPVLIPPSTLPGEAPAPALLPVTAPVIIPPPSETVAAPVLVSPPWPVSEAPATGPAVVAVLPAAESRELARPGEPGGGPTRSGSAAVVRFPAGSASLVPAARDTLRLVADLHREQGGTIRVVGHASTRTREMPVERHKMVNFGVSLRRAQVVADALIRLGVTPEAISVGAMSDNEPIYHEWMPSGEAGNRRAEIFLDY